MSLYHLTVIPIFDSELRLIKHSSLIHDLTLLIFLRHPDLCRLHSEHNLKNRLMISSFSDNRTWCCFKVIKSQTLLSLLLLVVLLFFSTSLLASGVTDTFRLISIQTIIQKCKESCKTTCYKYNIVIIDILWQNLVIKDV